VEQGVSAVGAGGDYSIKGLEVAAFEVCFRGALTAGFEEVEVVGEQNLGAGRRQW
jgi:hypothetical protein